MKNILLLGAGKSATVLIEYLKKTATQYNWSVTVADANAAIAAEKAGQHALVKAVGVAIENAAQRIALIQQANVVISMLPPALHYIVAKDCMEHNKHLLTASYVDENLQQMATGIQEKQLLFLCEMGLDPGIDHMSAMQMIASIQKKGGKITSFQSHCGGLVAPESDDNAWHYKISWNPRNVVMAGKAGAVFKENNTIVHVPYQQIFANCTPLKNASIPGLVYYSNRDSLHYMNKYALSHAATFKRTTIRYTDFCKGWQWMVDWQLTDEKLQYATDGMCIAEFYQLHFEKIGLEDLYHQLPTTPLMQSQLQQIGWYDVATQINKGTCSAADVLQFILEKKWALQPNDKDLVMMIHEIEYTIEDQKFYHIAELKVTGENAMQTAMAKTVGLPLGIAATLLLNNQLNVRGLHIPTHPAIYNTVLPLLEQEGVCFTTSTHAI